MNPVFSPIPMPSNDMFKDVMGYLEKIQERKAMEKYRQQTLEQQQSQFDTNKNIELQKLAELANYHKGLTSNAAALRDLRMDLLKEKILQARRAGETPEEKMQREIKTRTTVSENVEGNKEGNKIKNQIRSLINLSNLTNDATSILNENPNLTGIGSGLSTKFNLSNNPALGKFSTITGKMQAEIGRYASQRGGIQSVKWAEKIKPSEWKSENYNYGMLDESQQNIIDEYNSLASQYKDITGKDINLKLPSFMKKQKTLKIMNKKTGEIKYVSEDEAKKLTGAS